MNLKAIRNEAGDLVKPTNVMLHDGEGKLVFTDEYDPTQLYNFDLNEGKIVEQF